MIAFLEGSYFVSILSFLLGLKYLGKPKKAKLGNSLAAIGMTLAVVVTIITSITGALPTTNLIIILGTLLFGTILGKYMAKKVEMTAMPQLVSIFNATGGACAFLLGIMESGMGTPLESWQKTVLILGVITGAIATSGSVLAYLKLAGRIKDNRSKGINYTSKVILLAIGTLTISVIVGWINLPILDYVIIVALASLMYGILFVLPIGGADMPVVISLLNSITGIATALSGILYHNNVMIAGGILVGASGILLTILMCKAMNRSLLKVVTGSFNKSRVVSTEEKEQQILEISSPETALKLSLSKKVAIIPGYGLAVAQAQHLCKELENVLNKNGTEVHYIIHPVAGRMPGHMNVLLAEAAVEYDSLKEMDQVNAEMANYDTALIIGANDVVNPAAENNENSPIYGMPIIKAYNCPSSIVLKRSMNNGYAGVQNELFETKNCRLLFGDAKVSLQEIVNQLKLI